MQAESLTTTHLGGSLFVFSCARNGAAVVAAHVAPVVYVSQFYEYSFLNIFYGTVFPLPQHVQMSWSPDSDSGLAGDADGPSTGPVGSLIFIAKIKHS